MVMFQNATLAIERVAATPGVAGSSSPQVLYTNVPAHVSPHSFDARLMPGGMGMQVDYEVTLDATVDIQIGDVLTGWNPRNMNPAPKLTVQFVEEYVGVVSHWVAYVKWVRQGGIGS